MPDNTILALKYGWELGGIPEVDIRQTKDGQIICFHDDTPARTTNAPPEYANADIGDIEWKNLKNLDAGARFNTKYAGERIPMFEEVLKILKADPRKMIYADLKFSANRPQKLVPSGPKHNPLAPVFELIGKHGLAGQIIIASPDIKECRNFKQSVAGIKTMIWIGGNADAIKSRFQSLFDENFAGLDIVQLHLNDGDEKIRATWRYQLERDYLVFALNAARKKSVALEVFPWQFSEADIGKLLDVGLTRYATDEPARFVRSVNVWKN